MDLKIKQLSDYGREICLQNLLLLKKIKEDLEQKGDISGVEKLEKEAISFYERIYLSLEYTQVETRAKENENFLEEIEKTLDKILKESALTKDFIMEQLEKRRVLTGKSGSEVIKKFFKYRLKEYKKKKVYLLEKINRLLDEEERLNLELSNSIQEEEQINVINKLQPIREKYRVLEQQLNIYQKAIEETQRALNNKWQYEIYGVREESEFLEAFLEVYENIHIET
ncbi:MAG: hypothetical protein Q4A58_04645 [Fusobacterium sp.]|uniref:hypothetical protein n=1 Tax=Fusobacterium sp. TaxID=68766 RepID=UPI0026DC4AAF|nr:hypothetical protein [Fusobacterium sp.]MDO4690564.1 hypothetical protein [Fusobacterium sp.]